VPVGCGCWSGGRSKEGAAACRVGRAGPPLWCCASPGRPPTLGMGEGAWPPELRTSLNLLALYCSPWPEGQSTRRS
jgi:hypothetical protein